MHLIWACDKPTLNIVEDKLCAARQYDRTQPDKKLIYISGKISGIEEEASVLFAEAKAKLIADGYEPVNPMELNHKHDLSWESYMRVDIKALMDCDGVYFMSNWQESKGAILEHDLAEQLGMIRLYETTPVPSLEMRGEGHNISQALVGYDEDKEIFIAHGGGGNFYSKPDPTILKTQVLPPPAALKK